jgi:glycyl-tRNA synthetase beta chain
LKPERRPPVADFLLEIGTEEIPAGMISGLCTDLAAKVEERLKAAGLPFEMIVPGGAPRRLYLIIQGLLHRQEDRVETVLGPPLKQAKSESGEWTQAALGFAKRQGVEPSVLREMQGPKGICAGFERTVAGRATEEILAEAVPSAVDALYLPKAMRWGNGEHLFVRPVRWVLALLDDRVVPLSIKGTASGRTSRGHRIFGAGPVEVPSAREYFKVMRGAHVIPDPEQRRRLIQEELDAAAQARGGFWNVSPETEDLLGTVTFLCEYPSVLTGSIPEEFVALPASILGTCLREHQKSFTLYEKDDRSAELRALPSFAAVIDAPGDPRGLVRRGNENVTVARLSDARFFFEHDRAVSLGRRLEELRGIVFHPKIGTYYDKAERIESISRDLAPAWGLDPEKAARAALLCKGDLVSLLVQEKEFTSLQGIAGGLYAEAQGEDPEVARAIRDHYRPSSPEEPLPGEPGRPETFLGRVVSAADKLDNLLQFFKLGLVPTGSKDPFALRRAAAGVVRLLCDRSLKGGRGPNLNLGTWLIQNAPEIAPKVSDFVAERLRALWESRASYDEINAILVQGIGLLWDMEARLDAVHAVREEFPADFDALSVAFKRSRNILKGIPEYDLNPLLFLKSDTREGGGERALHAAVEAVREEAGRLLDGGDYAGALRKLASVRPAVDRFFDDVLVMCDPGGKDAAKSALQSNRLALLQLLVRLFDRVADFSEFVPRNR